jgi:hypothetical protein
MGLQRTHYHRLQPAGLTNTSRTRARKLYGLTAKEFKFFVMDGRADVENGIERSTFSTMTRQKRHRDIVRKANLQLEHFGPLPLSACTRRQRVSCRSTIAVRDVRLAPC